jgi:hypothetical protein
VRLAIVVLSLWLSGCASPSGIYVQVEVWNRTLDPIFLVDQDGKRLDVPACGHAVAPVFHVNEWEVRTEQGRITKNSEGGQGGHPPNERYFIVGRRLEPVVTLPASGPLPDLPPCVGHPTVEDGQASLSN